MCRWSAIALQPSSVVDFGVQVKVFNFWIELLDLKIGVIKNATWNVFVSIYFGFVFLWITIGFTLYSANVSHSRYYSYSFHHFFSTCLSLCLSLPFFLWPLIRSSSIFLNATCFGLLTSFTLFVSDECNNADLQTHWEIKAEK